ncbi:HAD-IA family hydrolase [Quadrisphaera sp. INWT6]|uniref:HAD-IA family hydrolase n=1 Tax=Quadrisphaera sp. INWT6 TaxID=2596917 RepID=UPI0019D52DAD|nr:HAD-IA family hydrolase [Quadrisphaera sp. INWT6]
MLFDADGVLVDSHAGYASVWERWSRRHGLDPVAVLEATHARRPVDTIAEVAPHLDPVAEHAWLTRLVDETPEAFLVFADAAPLLAQLPPDRWAVVTSGDADRVRARLAAGALPLPTVLVDGASVDRGKPDPEGYLLAAERLGVEPAGCVVVEDAPAGVRAGRSAGMRVVGLTSSHPRADLVAAGADVVVTSLAGAAPGLRAWAVGQDRWRSAGPS